ncbi:MAG: protein kinase domain-containing protein [Thermoleophilaceae bacterium]
MPLFRRRRAEDEPDDQETQAGGVSVQPQLLVAGDLAPGTEVAGYRVQGLVGRGGMGVVYRAEHVHLGRLVALKLLPPGLSADFRERFIRESRLAASLSHPNVVTVYDAGDFQGTLYIAMELVRGSDLRALLRDEGPREPDEVVRLAGQVGSALDTAHGAGLVHRDVKPGNILIEGSHFWLSDFGLTKRLASTTSLTAHEDIVGTPDYLAPEQIEGNPIDGRVDQYALACVVHHALTGTPPFERDSDIAVLKAHLGEDPPRVNDIRPALPAELDEVLGRALAKDPAERYPSMADFARAVADALGDVDGGPPDASRAGYVLVAVTDPSTRAVIRAALGRGQLEVQEVDSAAALVERSAAARPALVVLDAALPGATVTELCRALRAAEGSERLPIVALAERGHDEQWREARSAGVDDVLLRPFSAFQLLAKVRDHVPRALER